MTTALHRNPLEGTGSATSKPDSDLDGRPRAVLSVAEEGPKRVLVGVVRQVPHVKPVAHRVPLSECRASFANALAGSVQDLGRREAA